MQIDLLTVVLFFISSSVNFDFMLHFYASNRQSDDAKTALNMVGFTEKMMAKGGIHDHIAQVG